MQCVKASSLFWETGFGMGYGKNHVPILFLVWVLYIIKKVVWEKSKKPEFILVTLKGVSSWMK